MDLYSRWRPATQVVNCQQYEHEKDLKVYHDFLTKSNHRTAESIDEPINKANLTLQHDGNVYTHPKCMKGVPIEKIHPKHPYWHLGWEDIEPWIEQLLHMPRNMPSQVLNATILEFLKGAEFCPHQLVAKKYIKSSLTRIDVIFRLAETMLALKSFKLDNVTPLEWFRQRLHEIINDEGSRFSLTMTILNFRHDPKYVKLRAVNGERTMDPSQTNHPNHDGLTTGLCWELKRIKCLVDTVGGGAYKTQYWQWITGDNWQGFRHWGLANRNGCPTWTIYDEPVNFHLKLEHIKKIRWATNTFKVEIVCEEGVMISDKPRGNLLAEFKRESTKHRFLYFCHHHSIFLEKTDDDKPHGSNLSPVLSQNQTQDVSESVHRKAPQNYLHSGLQVTA
ncbi:hypothetical protein CDEST_02006 [Colletotrichum destructivum]|uniref:Uncharacterized protein n=1 Tax=Colletotrichum destructivum TaxID=34406 RepID=A0AAX4I0R7_9PEZI|nr:hypothetical protein CDEST_02006 [Colletotrichum destructivum]